MLSKILFLLAYYPILELPFVLWLSLALFTLVTLNFLAIKGIFNMPFKVHEIVSWATFILSLVQSVLLLAIFLY